MDKEAKGGGAGAAAAVAAAAVHTKQAKSVCQHILVQNPPPRRQPPQPGLAAIIYISIHNRGVTFNLLYTSACIRVCVCVGGEFCMISRQLTALLSHPPTDLKATCDISTAEELLFFCQEKKQKREKKNAHFAKRGDCLSFLTQG